MRFTGLVALAVTFMWLSAVVPAEAQSPGCDSLVGVWSYVEPSAPGRGIIGKLGSGYTLVYFQTAKTDATPQAASASGGNFSAGVYDYECEGASGKYRWKIRVVNSLRVEDVGRDLTLEMEVQGDTAKWSFIGTDGKRVNPGAAKRVK